MNNKLQPNELRSFINKDSRFKRAEALLNDDWESLLLPEGWGVNMMTLSDIAFAKHLDQVKVVPTTIDLVTFAGVKKFIRNNSSRLSPDVVKLLEEPFL
ncbi:hypothetical protein [uncultured Leuconostoc sp.]|uniref:hypothetical protein n=1 Tax=uncultured Leuconostoc sp. TaxID=173262 RepID=UPI0025EBE816|nr:hypothetical protein [uncultured Leuconostoc sp.]